MSVEQTEDLQRVRIQIAQDLMAFEYIPLNEKDTVITDLATRYEIDRSYVVQVYSLLKRNGLIVASPLPE